MLNTILLGIVLFNFAFLALWSIFHEDKPKKILDDPPRRSLPIPQPIWETRVRAAGPHEYFALSTLPILRNITTYGGTVVEIRRGSEAIFMGLLDPQSKHFERDLDKLVEESNRKAIALNAHTWE